MKIAIVSDDHLTISAHFGRALFYEVFTIEAGKILSHETFARSNTLLVDPGANPGTDSDHHHKHDHNAMIVPIADCQVLLTRGMGRGAHLSLQEHDIQPVITSIVEISAGLEAFMAGTLVNYPERLH